MPVVTYNAVNRGYLVGGHSAGVQYKIETGFQSFPRSLVAKGAKDEALDGTPEGWLQAIQSKWDIQVDLVLAASIANWREFFTSVMAGETFQVDFTGTIASPGTNVNVWLAQDSVTETQVGGIGYQLSFTVKSVP